MSGSKISDEEIDQALIANITHQWRKVARIVGMMMGQIDSERRAGLMDLYFAERVVLLVEKGFIEYEGDLGEMRCCIVRLPQDANTIEKLKPSLPKVSRKFPPKNYQYRVIFKDGHLGIYGVYCDKNGIIRGMDIYPNVPLGYQLDDLRHKLELMLKSLDKEILDDDKLEADIDKLNRT
jgi:hypothetical protein